MDSPNGRLQNIKNIDSGDSPGYVHSSVSWHERFVEDLLGGAWNRSKGRGDMKQSPTLRKAGQIHDWYFEEK